MNEAREFPVNAPPIEKALMVEWKDRWWSLHVMRRTSRVTGHVDIGNRMRYHFLLRD